MHKKIFLKLTSSLLAALLCVGIIMPFLNVQAQAITYYDNYPDTHINTGKNITDLIAVAKTQIGYTELSTSNGRPLSPSQNSGYTKYGAYFGNPTGAWCAYFVAWCANKAGISSAVVPKIGNCANAVSWYKQHGVYHSASTYSPKPGDLIFYNWSGGSRPEHIGIVTGKSSAYIYTIEGNVGGSSGYIASGRKRTRSSSAILGFATPKYNDADQYHGSYSYSSVVSSNSSGTNGYSLSKYKSSSKLAVFTCEAADIAADDALLVGKIVNNGNLKISYGGFYIGKSKSSMKKLSKPIHSSKTNIIIKTDLIDAGYTIEANTKYYFCTYVVINSKTYKGPVYTFKSVDDRPKSISLTDSEIEVCVGGTYELMYELSPFEANDKGVIWSSDNEAAATVSDGIVTGTGTGNATITAKTIYGDVEAQCKVRVILNSAQNIEFKNVSPTSVKLTWDYDNEAFSYIIYRSDKYNGEFLKIAEVPADTNPSYLDKNLKTGKRYYYKIAEISFFGEYNSYTGDSSYVTVKLPFVDKPAVNQSGLSVNLSWENIEGASGYTVYRCDIENGIYSLIGSTYSTIFSDLTTVIGKTYYYKVKTEADNKNGASDFSESCEITTINDTPNTFGINQNKGEKSQTAYAFNLQLPASSCVFSLAKQQYCRTKEAPYYAKSGKRNALSSFE